MAEEADEMAEQLLELCHRTIERITVNRKNHKHIKALFPSFNSGMEVQKEITHFENKTRFGRT